ncbi:hypothetical protein [Nocardioides eburneiflavus]|uniref:hypothetical protein n=1 Tax=Nocardioides eburneiflavus TaxID=2518372 RepID=UPI001B2FE655|nr:hypothetical protein [Nocardioides eburneiflavus]
MTTTPASRLTASRLTAAAGVCAAVAGALYVGVQINHPPADLDHITGADVLAREIAKMTMAAFAILGFTGMLVRNRHKLGTFGAVSYVMVVTGYFALFANQVIVATVLPTLTKTDPDYVQNYLDGALGNTPAGDIGAVQTLFLVTGIGYSIGGLLFGIALFRAGILARWASALFAAGTVSALTLAVLPQSFNRPAAVPVGIALMGLGYSLWRNRTETSTSVPAATEGVAAPSVGSHEPAGR